tara:strand:- start:323 stop:544 length:222 start_codon:yes stop_codon:yes gene_type:complete
MIEEIIKHLRKKDKSLSEEEAENKAKLILNNYNEKNKDRDIKREEEHQRQWNEALKSESYNTLFEHADDLEEE